MNFKYTLIRILYFIWNTILPLLVVLAFNVGIFFNLWKVQMLPIWLSATITILTTSFIIFAFGKLLKKW
jgi:hypothetical protein